MGFHRASGEPSTPPTMVLPTHCDPTSNPPCLLIGSVSIAGMFHQGHVKTHTKPPEEKEEATPIMLK